MSTIEATVSMMESMPEDARMKVMQYAQKLFVSKKPANPFAAITTEQILRDLDQSENDISEGNYRPMKDVIDEMERQYGFI
ncbi:MAG: hypothetical protein LUI14_01155 [Lachnospiraceae bacterium]|nr:hypothetical protein [Lachnospiraceae bacterium]MCD7765404.1 hypothetical protein [Lachnospiraceae bacterium]